MMDKTIHNHLDRVMDIQDSAQKMLEEVFKSLDLRRILKNPTAELANAAHVAYAIADSHARDAVSEGGRFAKEVVEKGTVKVEKSKDPNLNEGELP